MPGGFRQVRLFQFRNLVNDTVDLDAHTVVLVGNNGQGKTNLLESLYLLSYGNSFRTHHDRELCTTGTDSLRVTATYGHETEHHDIDVRVADGRKTIELDEQTLADRRDLVNTVPTVLFQHDDMQFVTAGPDMHRMFLDQTLSMVRLAYIDDLRRYRRILRSRNAALKDERFDLVKVYDPQLAEAGISLQQERATAVARFSTIFSDLYGRVSQLSDPVSITYIPSWRNVGSESDAVDLLSSHIGRDAKLRTTTSGPHRDRLRFGYRGADFLDVASTGQIRLIVLILRVAQATFVHAETRREPVLLLDDVMLELDPSRRTRFLDVLPPARQRLFTVLPGESLHGYGDDDALIYSVTDGRFERTARR